MSVLTAESVGVVSEYGAPEEGELKKPEPFALKNQLLSKSRLFLLSAP